VMRGDNEDKPIIVDDFASESDSDAQSHAELRDGTDFGSDDVLNLRPSTSKKAERAKRREILDRVEIIIPSRACFDRSKFSLASSILCESGSSRNDAPGLTSETFAGSSEGPSFDHERPGRESPYTIPLGDTYLWEEPIITDDKTDMEVVEFLLQGKTHPGLPGAPAPEMGMYGPKPAAYIGCSNWSLDNIGGAYKHQNHSLMKPKFQEVFKALDRMLWDKMPRVTDP